MAPSAPNPPGSTDVQTDLKTAMADMAADVERAILHLLPTTDLPESRVLEAMRYGCLNGGKRLRPFLVCQSAALFGVNPDCALRVAVAVEFVHSYSLVHDDLPAMDDGDLRRGQPTVHRKFDEATAILAGDGLLTYAFEVLADPATHEDPNVRCQLVAALAKAAGPHGMVGGQMLDLIAEHETFDLGTTTRLQRMKTGDMIAFSCEAGGILGKAPPPQRLALRAYAHDLGLAFQIVDDLLDVEGTEAETGKSVGRDAEAGKSTFVSILGQDRARSQAAMLAVQAKAHLEIFEGRADILKAVADFVVARRT
ncbi:polyprenyl synthetase family protein [Azospirillum brasilense]|uniref:Polyprenyl synthetase family protein n=2 Tax=Azospirillum brasilense TaxID=192 RepID=A0A0P0F1X2_AZOBR|nr:farnesyl-diphosphate synthase [Azospirillum brasilense]PWC85319.1 farnesyl-diphosphate synthase [Azospirillum sp. Sp 7]NUB11442.1 polyprenyl synthetase family protein [Azospirillum brasilense]NUB23751.1 polyprenyl synthetase family protein [Azospirillum brasilense]NUB30375.1 polyprenyl synthetase family protein [Azospirillum brasilense]